MTHEGGAHNRTADKTIEGFSETSDEKADCAKAQRDSSHANIGGGVPQKCRSAERLAFPSSGITWGLRAPGHAYAGS